MKSFHLLPSLGLSALLGSGGPAMAQKKFVNRSEFLICLVPDPEYPLAAPIEVAPGTGCAFRDRADSAETATLREETKAAGAGRSPIPLRILNKGPLDTRIFLDPGGSVSFSAAAGSTPDPGTRHEARFTVCSASLAAAGGMTLRDEFLAVGFEVHASLDGDLLENLTCRRYRPAGSKPGWSGYSFAFQTPDSDDPDLRLVDRTGASGCSVQ